MFVLINFIMVCHINWMTKIRFQRYFCKVIWYVTTVQNTIAYTNTYLWILHPYMQPCHQYLNRKCMQSQDPRNNQFHCIYKNQYLNWVISFLLLLIYPKNKNASKFTSCKEIPPKWSTYNTSSNLNLQRPFISCASSLIFFRAGGYIWLGQVV